MLFLYKTNLTIPPVGKKPRGNFFQKFLDYNNGYVRETQVGSNLTMNPSPDLVNPILVSFLSYIHHKERYYQVLLLDLYIHPDYKNYMSSMANAQTRHIIIKDPKALIPDSQTQGLNS